MSRKKSDFFIDSILAGIEENEDGSFHIKNKNGTAILSVVKPGTKGKAVTNSEVVSRLHLFGILQFDKNQVELIVKNADGREYEIAEWKGGEPEDARANIDIEDAKMKAVITVYPARHGGKSYTKESLVQFAKDFGIQYGIQEEKLEELLNKQLFGIKTPFAFGKEATPPQNGYIKVYFDTINKPNIKSDEKGKVDFKNIYIIKNVKEETLIAEKIPSIPGSPGRNVLDEELPPLTPQEAQWLVGENCVLTEDQTRLFSTINGRPIQERDGTIKVDQICVVDKVDYSTGNIDFPGTIIVEGTVADNFTLKTRGSIVIKKSVGRVFLEAGGDIILTGGVMGRAGGKIQSDSDIYAKFVEQATIRAKKSIFITEASMHSDLVAGEGIIIQGGRGELIGGEAVAGQYVTVNKLGAIVETKTSLVVGISPEVLAEINKMKHEIATKNETIKKIRLSLNKLSDIAVKRELATDEKEMLKKLLDVEKKFSTLLQAANDEYESVINTYEPNPASYVEVEKNIYPKVNINLGRGRNFSSEIRILEGKNYVYVSEGNPVCISVPPKSLVKREETEKK